MKRMGLARIWFVLAAGASVFVLQVCGHGASDVPATERIFDVLDLSGPGLAKVKRLHEAGKNSEARQALVDYIRRTDWARRVPEWWKIPDQRDPEYSDPIAEDLLRNVFHLGPFEVFFGPKVSDITWYEPPMDQIDDVHLYYGGSSMNRHSVWMPQLAQTWWHTGEKKYAEKLVEILLDFITRCPIVDSYQVKDNQSYVTAADEDGDGKPDRPGSAVGMVWRPFCTGRRVQTWKNLFVFCPESEAFTPEIWCKILVSIDEQVDSLVRKMPDFPNRSNHATRMGLALLDIADFWPLMADTDRWRKVAISKLGKAYNWFDDGGFIYADGAQTEIKVSTGPVQMVAEVIETATKHDIEVPDHLLDVHEAMAEYAFGLLRPSTFGTGQFAELGHTIDSLHNRKDLLYIATGGKEGTKPDFVSWPPRSGEPTYAGTYFMRSDWTPDAKVLRTRFGPTRYSSPTSGSGSMGEVSVFADGMFLVPFIATSVYRGEFKAYGNAGFVGDGRSRNTIAVDDLGQSRFGRIYYAEEAMDNSWITSPVFDYLRGSYAFDPGQHKGIEITHTRSILFARPDYYLVIDRITPSDEGSHDYRMKYQLSHPLETQTEGLRATGTCDRAGIVVEPLAPGLSLEIIKGQKEPYYEGWDPAGGFTPAPALIYRWRAGGPTGTETLLYPYTPGSGKPGIKASADRADDGSVCITITGCEPDTTDVILISGESGKCSGGGFELTGRLAFVRLSGDKPISAGIVEGTSLAAGDQAILNFASPLCAWGQCDNGGTWQHTVVRALPQAD